MHFDRIKGMAYRLAGRIMEAWAKMTGNWRLRAKGKAAQWLGSAHVRSGRAKHVIYNAANRIKGAG